jgi:hypothetical protein
MMLKYNLFALLFFCQIGFAQLSPGDLHNSHAHLEGLKNCSKCHGVGQRLKAFQCLECHQILKEEISQKKGLHSRSGYQECQKCHVEHHGRDFDLIWWENGKENFKHELTGFTLLGQHLKLKCNQCHREKYITEKTKFTNQGKDLNHTFLGLSQNCRNCHMDEHRGQLSSTCLDCHSMEGWKPAPDFNHSKTKFVLTGKHKNVQCARCHKEITDNKYEEDKTFLKFAGLQYQTCTNCHKDVHQNKFGQNCAKCHNTTGWANYNSNQFDHTRTKFPLKGIHQRVACEKCHTPGQPLTGLKFSRCKDCHQDYHRGQFTNRIQKGACEECHTVDGFTPSTFTTESHNKTQFSLQGAHLAIPCIACHKKTVSQSAVATIQFTFASFTCPTCHQNPHAKSVDKFLLNKGCDSCHILDSWRTVQFDHNQTNFSLEFKHNQTPCKSCHFPKMKNINLKKYEFVKLNRDCQNCHKDPHNGQFMEANSSAKKNVRCDKCHTPRDWKADKFDHNLQASFKLEGAHEHITCDKCHLSITISNVTFVQYKPIPHNCADCHGKMIKMENDRDAKFN